MTLSEFKAWFEGFSEGIDKAPTEKQFAKIKAKVALIDGAVTTYPVFIDRYRHYYDRIWRAPEFYPYTVTLSGVGVASASAALERQANDTMSAVEWADKQAAGWFDSHAAMRELGRAEALN